MNLKQELQNISETSVITKTDEYYEKVAKKKIFEVANNGGTHASIRIEEYEDFMENPKFVERLKEITGLKVDFKEEQTRTVMNLPLTIRKIIFDWSDD